MDNYHAVDIYSVVIYCLPNGGYKVFYSHSRDLLGMGHSYGTCALIEIDSLMNLVQHFQNTYAQTSDIYEIKGVRLLKCKATVEAFVIFHKLFAPNFTILAINNYGL